MNIFNTEISSFTVTVFEFVNVGLAAPKFFKYLHHFHIVFSSFYLQQQFDSSKPNWTLRIVSDANGVRFVWH